MTTRMTMNVSVTPELEQFVQALVASGRYHTASEVFRDGLRLLERSEQERLLEKWLVDGLSVDEESLLSPELLERGSRLVRSKIQEGLEALRRGEVIDGEKMFQELRDHSERKRAAKQA